MTQKEIAELILQRAFGELEEILATEVMALARENGVRETTLRNAGKALGIRKRKSPEGPWVWYR
jgi:hypothetical protein